MWCGVVSGGMVGEGRRELCVYEMRGSVGEGSDEG